MRLAQYPLADSEKRQNPHDRFASDQSTRFGDLVVR
jgi:hypothetical protein